MAVPIYSKAPAVGPPVAFCDSPIRTPMQTETPSALVRGPQLHIRMSKMSDEMGLAVIALDHAQGGCRWY